MSFGRMVQVVEVAARRPTRGLTLCNKAEVRPPSGDVDYATRGRLARGGRRARVGGGSNDGRARAHSVRRVAAIRGGDRVDGDRVRREADRATGRDGAGSRVGAGTAQRAARGGQKSPRLNSSNVPRPDAGLALGSIGHRRRAPRRASNRLLFFFNDTATTEIYTLSLHDALPISHSVRRVAAIRGGDRVDGDRVRREADRATGRDGAGSRVGAGTAQRAAR